MIRRYVLFFVALLTLSGSLTATAASIYGRDFELRGYVDATRDADLPFRMPRLGVNVELRQYDDDELTVQLHLMQQAHITWLRQFVYWDQVEPEPGRYDWVALDRIIEAVNAVPELQLVLVLMNSPDWTRESAARSAPPDDPADFGRFTQTIAERYGDSIDYYQIWDEPNLNAAWGGLDPRPAQYAALLQNAYEAIHHADPRRHRYRGCTGPHRRTGAAQPQRSGLSARSLCPGCGRLYGCCCRQTLRISQSHPRIARSALTRSISRG